MRVAWTTLLCWLALASCGGSPDPSSQIGHVTSALASFAGPNKFVVWQHNISFGASPAAAETAIKHAMNDYSAAPDIFTFQECSSRCICGETGKFTSSTGKCETVGGASIERALRAVGQGNKYTIRRNGSRVIFFRDARFSQIGSVMRWGATASGSPPYHAACSTVKVGEQLSVMLKDVVHSPEMQVLAGTGHWFVGRDCACRQVRALETHWKTAPELRDASQADARDYVDIHLLSGDWNATPSSGLPLAYKKGGSCDGANLGGETHTDTAGNLFTFCQGSGGVSAPTTCYNKKKVDYLWARNYNGSGITWKGSPDLTANYYNDHRALRTVFTYAPSPPSQDAGAPRADAESGDRGAPTPSGDSSVDDGAAEDRSADAPPAFDEGTAADRSADAAPPSWSAAGGCGCALATPSPPVTALALLLVVFLRGARRRRRARR